MHYYLTSKVSYLKNALTFTCNDFFFDFYTCCKTMTSLIGLVVWWIVYYMLKIILI